MMSVGLLSNSVGSILFLTLTTLLLINWRGQLIGGVLITCCFLSTLWFAGIAYNSASGEIPLLLIQVMEDLRTAAWLIFIYLILKHRPDAGISDRFKLIVPIAMAGLPIAILIALVSTSYLGNRYFGRFETTDLIFTCFLLLSLLGILLVEQLYRSTRPDRRWAIKFLCLGIGGIFIYDFFLYSDALLFNRINPDFWFVRGFINGLCVPFIAISVARNPQWEMDLFVSRHVVYRSTATMAAGIYLIVMALTGYYVRNYGGTWGMSLQVVFFFAALMVLIVFMFSSELRDRLKVFIAKHFYKNKYDYREEWLDFTRTLADNKSDESIYKTVIKSIANIIKSPGGILWLSDDTGQYKLTETWKYYESAEDEISIDSPFVQFMVKKRWIINLDQYRTEPDVYDQLEMPDWLISNKDTWLIVPLINDESLLGFIVLLRPATNISFDWEDIDLLQTVGFQIAGYIALLNVTGALSEARQFEAFNRLSAFVVHDLKNLVAQLSLISTNARKYKDNTEFIDDAFDTIDNAVAKMKRLLANLKKGVPQKEYSYKPVELEFLVKEVIKARQADKPLPTWKPG